MSKEKNEKGKKKHKLDISYTQNRELSWLKFNERVLDEAADRNVPLYERLKFVSIFTSNLDEFFMVRVGSLHDLSIIKKTHIDNKTGKTPSEQLEDIFSDVKPLYKKRDEVYDGIEEELRQRDVCNLHYSQLNKKEKEYVLKYYEQHIEPILSPQIVDSHHPFPHLANNELYVCLSLRSKQKRGDYVYGFLPVPASLSKVVFIPAGDGLRYILTCAVILKFAEKSFPMQDVFAKSLVKVTRNADINPEDEQYDVDDDFRHHMKKLLKKRNRLEPVRLEFSDTPSKEILNYLVKSLNLNKEQVYTSKSPLQMSYVFSLADKIPRNTYKVLSYEPFSPQDPAAVNKNEPIVKQLARRDILLFFPYEKMEPFLRMVKEAAEDRNVVSIKITIYRLANKSKLIDYLINAVENGKEVTVLMELRARFDEASNINWSGELEEAGCKVIYGFDNYKVHSKICLITRKDKSRIQYITQIGTGNYNEKTAKMYTDLSLMTADQRIGKDAALFFQNMSTSNLDGDYNELLVSPYGLKNGILKEIGKETEKGDKGRIFMKMNSLTDRDIIDSLSKASNAGVKIMLNIRGICCLRPDVAKRTENIQVISIVGRFLEHPRIYCFGNSIDDMRMYIGSADMMTRNTERRVEILTPILSKDIKRKMLSIINLIGHDTLKARKLTSDGTYQKIRVKSSIAIDSQAYFIDLYKSYAREPKKQSKLFGVVKRIFRSKQEQS